MLDLKFIREHTDEVRTGIAQKKFTCNLITRSEFLRAQQNSAVRKIKNRLKKKIY
ncbi:MAG: hypothetical protein LBQ03_03035 [Puniceicoccales bacterium]|jgi:hypothetical protein|nr:hypothetical protein [Puniceicoccales bacterium]